jgi:hypothetical protein
VAGHTGQVRTRLLPFALLAALVLTGCSSGGSSTPDALGSTPTPGATTTAAAPAAAGAAAPVAGSTTAPPVGATAGPAPVASKGTAAVAPPGKVTTVAPGKPAASKATAPGTYTLDSSGTISYGTPPQNKDAAGSHSLVVSALSGNSQHSSTNGDQGSTDQTVLVRDTGTYLADLKLTSPAFSKEFRPATAVLFVPDPATVGMAWSYGGTTTDGKTTLAVSNKVARTETLTIGGRKVPCAVLTSHLVLSGDLSYTVDLTTWWSPELRLPVKDHSVGKGSFSGIPVTTDITDVMRSTTPS